MATRFVAVCPSCRGKFPWDPKIALSRCPLPGCGYETDPPDDTVICMPSLRGARMAQTDRSYRELEQSSEVRAQLAASALGVPVAEMSHLKVTNIKDNCKPGEVAAMLVVNDVTRHMDMLKARGGQVGFTNGSEWAAAAQSAAPRAGANAMAAIQHTVTRR